MSFWDSLHNFEKVIDFCFWLDLHSDYFIYTNGLVSSDGAINDKLGSTVSTMNHIVSQHLEFIKQTNKTLGEFNEKDIEVRTILLEEFESLQLKDINSIRYGDQSSVSESNK